MAVAVLRNMPQTARVAPADGRVGDILSVQRHSALLRLHKARQRVNKLCLPVSVDARDAHDFAPAHVKIHMVHHIFAASVSLYANSPGRQHDRSRLRRRFFHIQVHLAAHHHLTHLLLGGGGDVHGADVPPLAQDGAAVGHRFDLIELMRDEQDALSLADKLLHDLHQFVDLLRRQHRCGLVENKDLVFTVQHLQDLHTLLHAHRNIGDTGIRVHPKAVPLREGRYLFPGLVHFQKAPARGLHAQYDVFQHSEVVHQLEVLMHHADAQTVRVVWVLDLDLLPVFPDNALFRLVHAEQHAHQRGFARAVFPQQGVDLALFQLQRYVVVCDDTRELFGDVAHLDDILVHTVTPMLFFPAKDMPFDICIYRIILGRRRKTAIIKTALGTVCAVQYF